MHRGADLIVANRAYGDHAEPPGGERVVAGAGGLVAAVSSSIEPWNGVEGTLWIGAGRGEHDAAFVDERGMEVLRTSRGPLLHQRVFFDDETWSGHYEAVANGFLWPALHLVRPDLPARAAFFPRPAVPSAAEWEAFSRANLAFARAAAESGRRAAWIHDYQLGLAPAFLRETGYGGRIGFFLHTPFPPVECVRAETPDGIDRFADFVRGVLGADLAGFQTERDSRNFLAAARDLAGASVAESGLDWEGRRIEVAAFPVGVNTSDVRAATGGALPRVAGQARAAGLPLVVGLERADFTKGVPERLLALARAYEAGARFAYFGASSPTRVGVALYDGFAEVLAAAAHAASNAAAIAECPFEHRDEALAWPDVVSLLREADVIFTSSLADGMNLVPLQAAVAQESRARRGVVIAGQDAGISHAFRQFAGEGLAVIDPLEIESAAAALHCAVQPGAAGMSDAFVRAVEERDAADWAARFMRALEGA